MTAPSLSVIIVSYNAKEFLHFCLDSIMHAKWKGNLEIIVVDNNSYDGSVAHVNKRFPQVKTLGLDQNRGFASACNFGAEKASGDHLLFLNPDTIIQPGTPRKCYEFMMSHQDTGLLGVSLLDGSGQYLPESARNKPNLLNTAFKLLNIPGFIAEFFRDGAYYADRKAQEVDILPGAFLWVSRIRFIEMGGFDKAFFMYGEDVDISYRFSQAGYVNRRMTGEHVLHFKGESTDKKDRSYSTHFYGAFSRYALKHGLITDKLRTWLLHGIVACIRWKKSTYEKLKGWLKGLVHLVFFAGVFFLLHKLWPWLYFGDAGYYSSPDYLLNVSLYALMMTVAFYWSGAFINKSHLNINHPVALLLGYVLCMVIYALLPADFRFSRMALLLGWVSSSMIYMMWRNLPYKKPFANDFAMKTILVSNEPNLAESKDVKLLNPGNKVHHCKPEMAESFIADHMPGKVIFDVSSQDYHLFIRLVRRFGRKSRLFLYDPIGKFMLSSHHRKFRGTVARSDTMYALKDPVHRHQKRLFDLLLSILLLILIPLAVLLYRSLKYPKNILRLLAGRATLVGYHEDSPKNNLPVLPMAFISKFSTSPFSGLDPIVSDSEYARNYSVWKDLNLCIGNFGQLMKQIAWKD